MFNSLVKLCGEMRLAMFGFKILVMAIIFTPLMAYATAGCGEITSIIRVNKEPMDDIYRLNQQGVSAGGLFAQVLSAIPGVGIFAAVVSDMTIEAVASGVRRANSQAGIEEELQSGQYKDVYDVTIKPDFGNPISITIRENEIDRFGLKEGVRAVIYYPNTDPLVVTGEGKKIATTRPSFSKKIIYSWTSAADKPTGDIVDSEYKSICYLGQKAEPYFIASGPWNGNDGHGFLSIVGPEDGAAKK